MLPTLTDRQKAIYDFLLKTIREKGFAPSIPEIGNQVQNRLDQRRLRSSESAGEKRLHPPGRQTRHRGRRCSGKPVLTAIREIPILGRVPAGKPFLSEENSKGF